MAIERTVINGDWAALKTALETLIPGYFAAVETPNANTIACKDADGNTIFTFTWPNGNPAVWAPTAYRDATHALATSGYPQNITNFYKVGVNGAFMTVSGGGVVTIAKASNGKTAITLPKSPGSVTEIYAACWGDDTAYDRALHIADGTSPTLGNNCLLVPVPLFGNYQTPNNVPKVFFMPVAQANMRGIVQEVTSDSGTYITNGYLAMLYDAGGEA